MVVSADVETRAPVQAVRKDDPRPDASRMTERRKAMLKPFWSSTVRSIYQTTKLATNHGEGLPETVGRSFNPFRSILSIRPPLAGGEELRDPYVECWAVFAALQWQGDAMGAPRPVITVSAAEDAAEISPDHPIAKLFAKPTDYTTWTQEVYAWNVNKAMTGEHFWFLADDDGNPIKTNKAGLFTKLPTQLVSASGDEVSDIRDSDGLVTKWWYSTVGAGRSKEFPFECVLQDRIYNREDKMRGVGPIQVATRELSIAFQWERQLEAMARAGGTGGFLTYNKSLGVEGDNTRNEVDQALRDSNKYTVLDGNGEWTWHEITKSPKDLQAIETLDRVNHMVCGLLGVAPPLIGLYGDAIFKNIEEGSRQSWLVVASKLRALAAWINANFFDRCADPKIRAMRFGFDFSSIDALREDETDRFVKAAELGPKAGLSFNESCATLGLEPAPSVHGDEVFVLTTMTPIDLALNPPEPVVAPSAASAPPDKAGKSSDLAPNKRFLRGIPLLSEIERREFHRSFAGRALDPFERRMFREVKGWLGSYARAQVKQVEDYAHGRTKSLDAAIVAKMSDDSARIENELLVDWERWAMLLDNAVHATIADTWQFGLRDAASELGSFSIGMSDPRVLQSLTTQLIQLREGVTSTLAKKVKAAIFETLQEATSIGTLQERVLEQLPALTDELGRVFGSNESRALTIARTETGHASNGARIAQYKADGVEEIQWITAHDDAVRESHRELDGQTRKLGVEFKANLRYPHDPSGSAAETIQCRCVPLAIVPGV